MPTYKTTGTLSPRFNDIIVKATSYDAAVEKAEELLEEEGYSAFCQENGHAFYPFELEETPGSSVIKLFRLRSGYYNDDKHLDVEVAFEDESPRNREAVLDRARIGMIEAGGEVFDFNVVMAFNTRASQYEHYDEANFDDYFTIED